MIYQKRAIKQALTHMSRRERGGMSVQKVRELTSGIKGPITRRGLKSMLRGDESLAHKATKRQVVRNILGAVEKTAHPVSPVPQPQEKRAPAPRFVPQPQKPKPAPIVPKEHKATLKPTAEPKKESAQPPEKKESLFAPKPSKTVVPEWMKNITHFKKETSHEDAPMPGHMTAERAEQDETEENKLAGNAPKSFVPRFAGTSTETRPDLGKPSSGVSEESAPAARPSSAPSERPAPAPTAPTRSVAEIDAEIAADESSVDSAMNETFGGGEEK